MRKIHLPHEYALILQEVEEREGDYLNNLAESLRFDRDRLMHILRALQHKRLITLSRKTHETFVTLTRRGHRFVDSIWQQPSFAAS